MCEGREDLTEDTNFMLGIMRTTNSIEDAVHMISMKLDFMHKVFKEIRQSSKEIGDFAASFLRNLDPKNLGNKSVSSIELLL